MPGFTSLVWPFAKNEQFSQSITLWKPVQQITVQALVSIRLMEEILHQLRLVVYPIIYRVLAPSQVVFSPDFWLPSTVCTAPSGRNFGLASLGTERAQRGKTRQNATGILDQRGFLRGGTLGAPIENCKCPISLRFKGNEINTRKTHFFSAI